MNTHVFYSFLENKQELLKKIADKLASAKDLDRYDDPYEEDMDQSSPHTKTMKNSKASFVSRISRNAHRDKHIVEGDSDMGDDIKSLDHPMDVTNEKHSRRKNQDDLTPVILDQNEDNFEEQNNFEDKANSRRKNRNKNRGSKRSPINKTAKQR